MTERPITPNQPNHSSSAAIEAKPTACVITVSRRFLDSALSGPSHQSPTCLPAPEIKPAQLHRIASPTKAHPGAVSPVIIAALTLAALATGLGAREPNRPVLTQAAAHTTTIYRIPANDPVPELQINRKHI